MQRLLYTLSFALIIAGSLSLVWLLQGDADSAAEITVADAISKVDKGEIKEARFTENRVEFIDTDGNKLVTTIGSDATRELLLLKIHEFMESGPVGTSMKVTEEPASAPLGWILLQYVPFSLLFIGIGLALGLFLSRFIRK